MKVFRDLDNLPKFKNAVITVGTFDGVHKGHQKILAKLNSKAQELDGESILITFHPHPRFVINPDDKSLKLINTLGEKIKILEKYNIDNLVIVPFNKDFSNLSADEYITSFLVNKFSPKCIAIGYDHHFGKGRKGDINLLMKYQKEFNYEILKIEKEELAEITISSTKIRLALNEGNVAVAKRLMHHAYIIEGFVTKGNQMGRTIGFPTANIFIEKDYKLIPKNGSYAVFVLVNNKEYGGMLNIGVKPTFEEHKKTIEVNIFDFDRDIYGEKICIKFISFLREEKKFDSISDLKKQLTIDKLNVLKIIKHR
jgi:riboflavin kinase/FMN adenylyltransferase